MADIFFKYSNNLKPDKGRLLISEPHLPDTNFDRTVVLLCDHNDEGSIGFVLNQPSLVTLSELMTGADKIKINVGIGGPVEQNTLHFLHRAELIEATESVGDGIYWGGDFDNVLNLLHKGIVEEHEVKFFLGYSGWSSGQLEDEIDQNTWIVSDQVSTDLVFDTSENELWKMALGAMGGRFSMYAKYPVDPKLN